MKARKGLIIFFLLPASLLYGFFFLLPAFQAFRYSFYSWSGFGNENAEILKDAIFWKSLKNTLLILGVGGILVFVLAFVLTVALNSGIKGKKFFRSMIFLPNVIAVIALTTLWAYIYNPSFGLIKATAEALGLEGISKILWTAPDKIFWSVLAALVWIEAGYYLVLIMAGVDKIPTEYYEAAQLEGASQFQIFRKITVPLIWDVLSVAVVLYSIGALKIFEFPYAFNGQSVPPELYTVGIYLYIMGFGKRAPIYRLGYATAIGVMLLLAVILIVVVLRRILRRDVIEY